MAAARADLRTGGTVAVLDTTPGSTTQQGGQTITVGSQPSSVAITPDGKKAYLSNSNGTVSVINTDPSSGATYNTVVGTIGVGPSPTSVQITRDGSLAYVANSNDTISVIDTNTNTVKTTVTIESTNRRPRALADGRALRHRRRRPQCAQLIDGARQHGPESMVLNSRRHGRADGSVIGSVKTRHRRRLLQHRCGRWAGEAAPSRPAAFTPTAPAQAARGHP
jgi:YVTN family beta-propeller protein